MAGGALEMVGEKITMPDLHPAPQRGGMGLPVI